MNLTAQEKEHVTLGIYRRPQLFSIQNYKSSINMGNFRWTVYYKEDFNFVEKVFIYFLGKEDIFNIEDLLNYIAIDPDKNNNKTPTYLRNIALKNGNSIE
jgi:spore coat polysaccharide biosynthesis protein SpsF